MTIHDIAVKHGLSPTELTAFEEYTLNRFAEAEERSAEEFEYQAVWEKIVRYSDLFGAEAAINSKICPKRPVKFNSPETLKMTMLDSTVGRIPVIYVRNTDDFEQLVTNVAYGGIRPDNISQTGASFIHGKMTRLIILSAKPYSNVPASELGLDEEDWAEKSLLLRREHELTHYCTRQLYGVANNILHDEIMADFMGLYGAFGYYRAEWFLRFMGIIKGSGGRLVFYTEKLPEKVRGAVSELTELSAMGLERWSQSDDFKAMTNKERIKFMCKAGFDGFLTL